MKSSQGFLSVFFESRPISITRDWQSLKAQLFLPEGSQSALLELYELRPGQTSVGPALNLQQLPVNGHESPRLDFRGLDAGPGISVTSQLPLTILRAPDSLRSFSNETSRSQIYFIRQRNSYSALSTSLDLYDTLASTRCISPSFLSLLQYLGERDSEVEIVPPAPKLRFDATGADESAVITIEAMMGIRFVELHGRSERTKLSARWSLRQSAIYMRGGNNIVCPTALFVTPSKTLQARLEECLPTYSRLDAPCVIEVQALILEAAITSWRPYIIDLTAEADIHAAQVLGVTPDDSGPMSMSNAGERQSLMILDEKVQNSLSAVRHTKELLEAVLHEYDMLCNKHPDMANDDIFTVFKCLLRESDVFLLRLEALQTRLQGVANIVSSFLELSSGFALQQLTRESRRENEAMRQLSERMHHLTEKATQDAAAVKVLTIMTMIYLPATVVSNFFSTSFVSTNSNQNIIVLSDWWIFVATTVPLTMLTLYIWLVWMRIQAHHTYPWWWIMSKKSKANKGQPMRTDEEDRIESSRVKQA
jgi:hypothetical protein